MFKYVRFAQYLRNLVLYICLAYQFSMADKADLDEYGRTPLSKNITAILDRLVHKSTYDKRLRPNYGGEPVEVGITIFVSSISAVSEVEMDYTLDIYLRQMWSDRRLAFNSSIPSITIDVEYMKSIWVPDTFFPNEKKSLAHTATTHNSFLRISTSGSITTSQRLTVTAACAMDLLLFPLDSQECTLEIESYGYSSTDIKYIWFKGQDSVTKEAVNLPQFLVKDHKIDIKETVLSTGSYSRLICRFLFLRSIGFYMIQIYLPSSLIVIISWVSFWLSRDATPARVALGVTTVLTMTTLMTTTNAAMPKVSYIKSIDVYLGTCFLMVFASLLEYAAVGYLNKRLKMRREIEARRQNQMVQQTPSSPAPTDTSIGQPHHEQYRSMSEPMKEPLLAQHGSNAGRYSAPTNVVTPLRAPLDYGTMKYSSPSNVSSYGVFSTSRPCDYTDDIRLHPPPRSRYSQQQQQSYPQLQSPSAYHSDVLPFAYDQFRARRRSSECDCDLRAAAALAVRFPAQPTTMVYAASAATPPAPPPPQRMEKMNLIRMTTTKKKKTKKQPQMVDSESGLIRRRRWDTINPSSIDKYSRILFPVVFTGFNIIYWLVYSHISQKEL